MEAVTGKTKLVVDFGGGIKKEEDVKITFDSGAAFATIGSVAVNDEKNFLQWLEKYGAEKFILGADVREEKIVINGWLEATDIWIYDFIEKYIGKGVQQIFCTDIHKDGKLEGPSVDLYKNIIERFPLLHFIASGGIRSVKDIEILKEMGCKGIIVGKAIYEGKIQPGELVRLF